MSLISANMKRKPRNKPIFVKATQQEHTAFTNLAISRNTTLSELIRQLLHRELDSSKKVAA
jgi:hypothetical protein